MFRDIGLPEILVILVVLVFLFGASKLPQIGNSLGRSIREFKKGVSGEEERQLTKVSPASSNHTPQSPVNPAQH